MRLALAATAVLTLMPFCVSASPSFRNLSPMNSARAGHTATVLQDGSVLIVGGFIVEGENAGVELLDSKLERFQVIDNAATPRQSHTASLLPDGSVLITGGYDARVQKLDSAEIFNPSTRKFVAAGRMNAPRANHIAISLSDGHVVLLGEGKVDVFDPKSKTFAEMSGLTIPHKTLQAAVLLNDGRIFLAATDRSTAILDLKEKQLVPSASMQLARTKFDAVVLADGRVLITGGSAERDGKEKRVDNAEIFDPARNSFTETASMNKARFKHRGSSVLLRNGWVLIGGGAKQPEIYNPTTGRFTLVGVESPLSGMFSAISVFGDRRVLITGGV